MNLLCTSAGLYEDHDFIAFISLCKAQHNIVKRMRMHEIASYLRFGIGSGFAMIDAIVCWADIASIGFSSSLWFPKYSSINAPLSNALALASEVRSLPETCVMHDGRKWRAILFFIIGGPLNYYSIESIKSQTHAIIIPFTDPYPALSMITGEVSRYTDRVLEEYRNFGMMVRFENGHVQIRPALRRDKTAVESDYYHPQFDRRRNSGWVTVKRDSEGLRHDVELFQQLLDQKASETEMHHFLREHPAFLMEARMGHPISHRPRFANPEGQTADFSLLPILGSENSDIEMLELKGPGERTLTHGLHAGFSAKLHGAINQVRDYDRYFSDPANFKEILRQLGFLPPKRNLAVLIGRSPADEERQSLMRRRQEEVDVKVISYDEILAPQINRLEGPRRYTIFSGETLRRESYKDELRELPPPGDIDEL